MNHKRDPLFADAALVSPDDPSQRPDPLYVGEPEDETVEVIAVDLQNRLAMSIHTSYRIDWRTVAHDVVGRVRELDGQATGRSGIVFVVIAAALAGALVALIAVGIVQASAPAGTSEAPRSGLLVVAAAKAGGAEPTPVGRVGVSAPAADLTPSPAPEAELGTAVVGGIAAYADRSFGPYYLAIPEGPGHRVRIRSQANPERFVDRVSTDAGPDLAMQRDGRVADLSWWDFAKLCACDPRIPGTMAVSIEYFDGVQVTPPATGTEP